MQGLDEILYKIENNYPPPLPPLRFSRLLMRIQTLVGGDKSGDVRAIDPGPPSKSMPNIRRHFQRYIDVCMW